MQRQEGPHWLASQALDHDLMVLFNYPLIFHDVVIFVAQAQWYFLDIMVFLDYILDVLLHVNYPPSVPLIVYSEWIGCFTANTRICDELFHMDVLVWLVCHSFIKTLWTIIEKAVKYIFPDDIICSTHSEGGKTCSSL